MGVVGVIFAIVVIGKESVVPGLFCFHCPNHYSSSCMSSAVLRVKSISDITISLCFVFQPWIASKVKAVAPAIPSGGAPATMPSVNNAIAKEPGSGSLVIASGDKLTTRRRGHSRKKTTTTTSGTTVNAVVATNDDEQGSAIADGTEAAKAAIKRVIRAILNRQ